jgi:hypothetical protein
MTRYFLRIAAELVPDAVTAKADVPGMLSASIDRGPMGLCRPRVEIDEKAARELLNRGAKCQ